MKGLFNMKLKNIIQLKNGFRVGFDITDEDFIERRAGVFNSGVKYKALSINRLKLEMLIKNKVMNEMDLLDIEIVITDINNNVFNGYAYFNIQPAGTYFKKICTKYNIKGDIK